MKFLLWNLVLLFLGTQTADPPSEEVLFEAESMRRQDLPDGFPVLLLNEDFAVLRVKIENRSSAAFSLEVEQLEVYSRKDDRLEQALSTEVTPAIVKYYKGGGAGAIYSQSRYGYPYPGSFPGRGGVRSSGTVPETGGTKIRASLGQEVRTIVESYQLHSGEILPGETVEGYIYLKSKDSGNKLKGGHVRFHGRRASF